MRRRQRSTSETAVSGTVGRVLKICAAMNGNVASGSQRKNRVVVSAAELMALRAAWSP